MCKKLYFFGVFVLVSMPLISYGAQAREVVLPGQVEPVALAAAAAAASPVSKPAEVVLYKKFGHNALKVREVEALIARMRQEADELERNKPVSIARKGNCIMCEEPYDISKDYLQAWLGCERDPLHVAHTGCTSRPTYRNNVEFWTNDYTCPGCSPNVLANMRECVRARMREEKEREEARRIVEEEDLRFSSPGIGSVCIVQ